MCTAGEWCFVVCVYTGNVIHFGDECRIKHVATMKYLVVEENADGSFEVHVEIQTTALVNSIVILYTRC